MRVLGENDPPPRPPRAGSDDPAGPPAAARDDGPGAPAPAGDRGSAAVVDPPPPDLITSDEPPADYSQPDYLQDAVQVIDPPFDTPSISRRTQSLPGILVGRELVKQTHLYTGEEIRVVSPLSDPSNPDATGTPIPFNRDYRVAGMFFTGMYEYDLKYVYVTLDSLQEFLDRGDAIDGIEVRVVEPVRHRRVRRRSSRPRSAPRTASRTGRSSTAACSPRSSSRRSRCSSCSAS